MFICPDCQVQNRSDAKFCRKCGRSRVDLERAVVTTPQPEVAEAHTPSNGKNGEHEATEKNEALVTENTEQAAPENNQVVAEPKPDFSTPECPSCYTALRVTDKYCCWCGEPQPNRVLPFMKLCLDCNTLLPEKANFCYSCGTDVGYNSRRKVRVPHELFKDEESEFFPRFDA